MLLGVLVGLLTALHCTSGLALTVQDDAGHPIVLAAPARRVISLAPHATELLFDVGAGETVVGVSDFSDFPAAAQSLPRIGGAQGLDLERIAGLNPDLVVAWTSGNSARALEALERLGIAVYRSDPESLEAVAMNLERLGILTGHAQTGTDVARAFRARIAALGARYSRLTPVTVFYQVWDKPLMTIGGAHLISDVIRLCGGRNIFASLKSPAPTVDAESVISSNPQVIVVASDEQRGPAELARWEEWPGLAAIRHRDLVILDPALITRGTPRIADGAERLCAAIDVARHR